MKVDTSGLEPAALIRRVNAAYDLGVTALTFVPLGEEASSYIAHGRSGERHFVRAQRRGGRAGLEAAYAAAHALRAGRGLGGVVAPYPTRRGAFTCRHAGHAVAVFPFVDGRRAYPDGLADAELPRAAALIAALHAAGRARAIPLPRRETFANPFERPIRRALAVSATPGPPATAHRRRVRRLLLAEQADLLATLATMRRFRATARRLDLAWAPTHGDPNTANILVDGRGELHLVDWGEVALGPPERDLHFFRDERFEAFLRRYLELAGPVRLHAALFEFYLYRWALQEVADYATRILVSNTDPRDDARAWEELQPYLPVPHAEIEAAMRQVAAVLRRVGNGVMA